MDDRSFVAGQDFLLAVKGWWTTRLYPALKAEYQRRAAADGEATTVGEVAALIEDDPLYRYYAWLERHLQRLKYAGRYGLQPYHDERRGALMAALEAEPGAPELHPEMDLPAYYTGVDVHQHPGGVWSDDIAGLVYERGARTTTPLLGKAHTDLHHRFTDHVAALTTPNRILDMGCGFGKSSRPFYLKFPEAALEGVDLSAPCLRLAAHQAALDQARQVRFRQMSALDTDYGDGEFDLVTSTMLIHEMPPERVRRIFDEAARLLRPGGRMVHLDFYRLPDAFARFIHYGHGRRNNEPFMEPLTKMDLRAELEFRGFTHVEILPFKEADGVDLEDNPTWRFPWTIIQAVKPG